MRSPIVRAIAIFAAIGAISLFCGWLVVQHLPANSTTLLTTMRTLAAAVLTIGGPIIGLFLGISHWRRSMRDIAGQPPVRVTHVGMRRKRATIFVAVGIPLGLTMMGFFGVMVVPAAWLAGGGDMPPGHGNPGNMQVGLVIVRVCIAIAAIGLVLLVSSIVVGIGLLLKGRD